MSYQNFIHVSNTSPNSDQPECYKHRTHNELRFEFCPLMYILLWKDWECWFSKTRWSRYHLFQLPLESTNQTYWKPLVVVFLHVFVFLFGHFSNIPPRSQGLFWLSCDVPLASGKASLKSFKKVFKNRSVTYATFRTSHFRWKQSKPSKTLPQSGLSYDRDQWWNSLVLKWHTKIWKALKQGSPWPLKDL